jgi:DNA-binding GntR family transcriptional regulator
MPTAEQVAKKLDVPMIDVEIAYQRLYHENFLHRDKNQYYVNYVYMSSDYYLQMTRLFDIIKKLGLKPSIKAIKKRITSIPRDLVVDSAIDPSQSYIHLRRIYYGNDIPLALMDIYFPEKDFPNFNELNMDEKPIYEAIFSHYKRLISSGRRLLSVVNLHKEDAKLLSAMPETASYQLISVAFDQHKQLMDVSRSISTMNQYFEVEFNRSDLEKITQNHFFYI